MRISSFKTRWTRLVQSGLVLAISFGLASQLVAQDGQTADIQVGDANGNSVKRKVENPWIGVAAGPVTDALRANFDIPGNSGLLIRNVVPGSPAEKAGLKEFDILIRADKNPLGAPADLVEIVKTWDRQTDGIKIEWLHRGKEMSEIVTPEERPKGLAVDGADDPFGGFGQLGGEGPIGFDKQIQELQKQFRQNGGMRMRFLGPGMQAAAQSIQSIEENGVKIRVARTNDEPAKIAVDDGASKWNVTEDQLDQLPDEIAGRVKKMLKNTKVEIGAGGGVGPAQNIQVPQIPQFRELQREFEKMGIPRMQQRFDDMEKQMERMLEEIERLQPPLAPPANENGINPDNDA